MNRQPWKFVVVTDRGLLDEMDKAAMGELSKREDKSFYNRMMERGGKIFYNAPAAIVVLKQMDADSSLVDLDCGIATQNIAIAAESLGLGNCICGMFAMPLEGPNGSVFKQKLGINDKWAFGMSVLLGYGAKGTPHAPDMEKIVML
jgi:nitroreductase